MKQRISCAARQPDGSSISPSRTLAAETRLLLAKFRKIRRLARSMDSENWRDNQFAIVDLCRAKSLDA